MMKRLSLELGGKNAAVVFKDARLDKAIPTLLRASFLNQVSKAIPALLSPSFLLPRRDACFIKIFLVVISSVAIDGSTFLQRTFSHCALREKWQMLKKHASLPCLTSYLAAFAL
jgi:Aldehyde dehydrogenase family